MTGQTTLGAFAAPQAVLPVAVYDCSTCALNKGIFVIGDGQKVRCGTSLRSIPTDGCGSWNNGDILAGYPDLPDNYQTPRKYRQRDGIA
jgi:hypothetical protein